MFKKRIFIVLLVIISLVAVTASCFSPVEFREVGGSVVTDCYGNLVPCADSTYDLGDVTHSWGTLYVDNILGMIIGGGNVTTAGGTAGTIAKFTAATNIENSSVTEAQVSGAVTNTHAQNTDTHLTSDGITTVIDAGVITKDLYTDRWLYNNSNTFFGIDAANATLAHTGGTEGWYNTAFGNEAIDDITTGHNNTAIGYRAGDSLTTGYYNTLIGSVAGQFVTTAYWNTVVGYQALSTGTGIANTAVGLGALGQAGDGTYNTAVGLQALNESTGDRNTAIGRWAGKTTTGDDNVFIGNDAGKNSGAVSNKLYIDNSDTATPLIYGDFSTNKVTINEDLDVADDATVIGTLNLPGDAIIKTDSTSARDLTITTGAAKTAVLTTAVYDDMQISMANVKTPAVNAPNWVSYKSSEVPAFSKTATNVLYFSAQLPHSYKEGSDLEFHIHIAYPDNGVDNSVWYFTYSWADVESNFPAASNSGNVILASPTTTDRHTAPSIIATISGAGKKISSVLLCSISRLGGDGSDSYDNVIYLVSGDFHYQKDTIGSRQLLVK